MRVTDLKARVRALGGDVTDVGYTQCGRRTEARVEVYFDSGVPDLNAIEFCDNVLIDREWDAANNGVMFEVQKF
jgi:hypothetical protein